MLNKIHVLRSVSSDEYGHMGVGRNVYDVDIYVTLSYCKYLMEDVVKMVSVRERKKVTMRV